MRSILGVNEEDKSLTFAGDIEEGSVATFMFSSQGQLLDGAEEAGVTSNFEHAGEKLSLAVSCVGRKLILASESSAELEMITQNLENNHKFVGFYSYGEISSATSSNCLLHNQTFALTTFAEVGD